MTLDYTSYNYPVTVTYSYYWNLYGGMKMENTETFETADEFKDFCENFESVRYNCSDLSIINVVDTPIEIETGTTTNDINAMVGDSLNTVSSDIGIIIVGALSGALAIVGIMFVVQKVVKFFKGISK